MKLFCNKWDIAMFWWLISYTGITVTPPCFCETWEASELRVLKKKVLKDLISSYGTQ